MATYTKTSTKDTSISSTIVAFTVTSLVWIYLSTKTTINKREEKRTKHKHVSRKDYNNRTISQPQNHLPPHIEREMRKEKKRIAKIKDLAMKTPMYDNVHMLDPQGELLCTISMKKAKWYIEKNIAGWVSPPSTSEKKPNVTMKESKEKHTQSKQIQLFFEPKNRSNRGEKGLYVRSEKINQCVACGNTDYHMRHYVVPFAYRSLFPPKFKSHLSHDIVILCPDCHVFCDQQRQLRMKTIEEHYRFTYNNGVEDDITSKPFIVDQRLYHLRSCALALLRWKDKLPESKRKNYEMLVADYLKEINDINITIPFTKEQLQLVIDVEYKKENDKFISGPELVVGAMGDDEEQIVEFVKGWRQHFLDTARPQFLPKGWGLDSNLICGAD